ncbi:MAG: RND transporter [Phycisphaerae bacterium]|nr:RND transporter [Phycisphaerae bacterium]
MLRINVIPLFLLCLCGMLVSCKVGPDYKRPDLSMPEDWAQRRPFMEDQGTPDWDQWWDAFADPKLNELIAEADANNRNLMIAVSRIDQYRARYGIASADLYPDIQTFAAYRRARVSDTDFDQPGFSVGGPFNNWGLGLDASWEIDLFGRIARTIEAATAEWEGMIDDWRNVMVTLRADVASSYISIRTLQARRLVVLENLKSTGKLVELTRDMEGSGTNSMLEVHQAEAQFYFFEAQLPRIEAMLAKEIGNLAVLLGRGQAGLMEELGAFHGIPVPPGEVAVGIPADIIRRRPDLRSAERAVAAATAGIGVAEAQLYPRLQLMGSFAFTASNFSDVWNWSSRTYNAGPAFSWDIFNGGRLQSAVKEAEAVEKQALLNYEQKALIALAEVETALAGFALTARERDILKSGVTAGQEAVKLATLQYSAGTLDFLTVLTAQQQVLTLQDELVQSQGLTAELLVELYRALGGGWTPGVVPPDSSGDDEAGDNPELAGAGKESA